jgi:hypothetical protein
MPKYFIGIVEDEAQYTTAGEADLGAVMAAHQDFAAAVTAAGGHILSGEALQPTPTATYLRGTRTESVRAMDNPLPEVKEVFGGFYLIDVPDDATALELAKKCPAYTGYIELRPVWEFNAS